MNRMYRTRFFVALASLALLLPMGTACAPAPQESQGRAAPPSSTEAVAYLDGEPITLAEVDRKGVQSNRRLFQDLYNTRRQALEEVIADRLLDREAASRGVTREELAREEITLKVDPVTDGAIEEFFNQNRGRMRGRTLDQVRDQIHQLLQNRNTLLATQNFVDRLKQGVDLQISLEPPRSSVTIAENDPYWGPTEAKVTIVEFSDFQ